MGTNRSTTACNKWFCKTNQFTTIVTIPADIAFPRFHIYPRSHKGITLCKRYRLPLLIDPLYMVREIPNSKNGRVVSPSLKILLIRKLSFFQFRGRKSVRWHKVMECSLLIVYKYYVQVGCFGDCYRWAGCWLIDMCNCDQVWRWIVMNVIPLLGVVVVVCSCIALSICCVHLHLFVCEKKGKWAE